MYLITYHNKWHKGNGITFREKMVATPKMIDDWKLVNTTSSSDPTYASKWWAWIKRHAEHKVRFTSEDWGHLSSRGGPGTSEGSTGAWGFGQ